MFLGKKPQASAPHIPHSIFIKILFRKFLSMVLPDEKEEVPATAGQEEVRSVAATHGHVSGSVHLVQCGGCSVCGARQSDDLPEVQIQTKAI